MDPRFYESAGPLPLGRIIAGLKVEAPEGRVLEDAITGVAALAESDRGHLCFLDGKANLPALDTAGATACFTSRDFAPLLGERSIIPLIVDAPKAAFGRALRTLYTLRSTGTPDIHPDAVVHPTAHIGPGVTIGARTRVGAFCVIDCADIGADGHIKAHAVIGGNGLAVAGDADGIVDLLHVGAVLIGDRVRIGSQTCIDRGLVGDTVVEDDVKLDNLVQVAHNCRVGARTICASFVGISGSCNVGADVRMGGQVGLADHLTIGDGATLLAKAGVMHDVPAGETWLGQPAKPAKQFMREVATLRKLAKPPRRDR